MKCLNCTNLLDTKVENGVVLGYCALTKSHFNYDDFMELKEEHDCQAFDEWHYLSEDEEEEEYYDPDNLYVLDVPCVYCNETGSITKINGERVACSKCYGVGIRARLKRSEDNGGDS